MIIEHPSYTEISDDIRIQGRASFELNMTNDDNQFSEEITPLILASQQNRFEIVMALLLKVLSLLYLFEETLEPLHLSIRTLGGMPLQ